VGKAILSALTWPQVENLIGRIGLPRFSENTITEPEALRQELENTRQRGYSIDNQEHELGLYCIGAAIRDSQGKPIGACSLSGLDPEIIATRKNSLSADLLYTAQEISRRMGYVPDIPSLIVP